MAWVSQILGLTGAVEQSRLMLMGMLPFAVYAACAGVAGYANPIPQPGMWAPGSMPQNHLRVMFENDSPSGRDRNYTHGTRVEYARTLNSGDAWGISLMQNIYTPELHARHSLPGQHPYCGYMALGGAYLWRGAEFGSGVELQLGTTGKPSCAGRFQNALHDMFDMPEWEGWHDQVPAEMTAQLTSRQEWLMPSVSGAVGTWQLETRAVLRESLGTVRLAGGGGLAVRLGRNLPPTAQSVGNAPTNFAVGLIRKPDYDPSAFSYYIAAELYADYVGRDISVDGGVFHHFERTCSRTPWQVEARLGVGASHRGIDYYAGLMLQSRTYRTQNENSLMGTFSLSWNW